MLTCQQLTELVTEYLEGRMSFWRRAQFQMHLGMCKRCRAYIHQMKATVRILGRLPSEPPGIAAFAGGARGADAEAADPLRWLLPGAPDRAAARMAARVFSGARAAAPRWPMITHEERFTRSAPPDRRAWR